MGRVVESLEVRAPRKGSAQPRATPGASGSDRTEPGLRAARARSHGVPGLARLLHAKTIRQLPALGSARPPLAPRAEAAPADPQKSQPRSASKKQLTLQPAPLKSKGNPLYACPVYTVMYFMLMRCGVRGEEISMSTVCKHSGSPMGISWLEEKEELTLNTDVSGWAT
ncbi:hypothetical protein NDU88_007700 [Pleurodeles waltl]|uniref:Uncharacterized protein n=1 Tax=Pleurodeles waltl TaxID=8319 RepID=A0AAV7RTL0_PLEWA|nr:hypothetical protein NDU88_007700 [Pleurodeles waltl]